MTRKPHHDEIGCYGDGALGHQHTRDQAATVLMHYVNENFTSRGQATPKPALYETADALACDLNKPMSDDAAEEYTACEWLNDHAPFEGAYWGWQDGDFGLWYSDDE